ncbi:MAG: hypothetical protein PHE83_17545 [Opitutaceae bacterium]|nr:hypothetical protein [Opitutaceae bacterium]
MTFFLAILLLAAAAQQAAELKVASLNCRLYFDPRIAHAGQVASQHPLTPEQYEAKTINLATLVTGYDAVALAETGGPTEIAHLAAATGTEWRHVPGRDHYTGEEVGVLVGRRWRAGPAVRVPSLHLLSKHALVGLVSREDGSRAAILVVHHVRPSSNGTKHAAELAAVRAWALAWLAENPGCTLVVAGDTNDTGSKPGSSIYGFGAEIADQLGFAPTHVENLLLDRIVLAGAGHFAGGDILRPPYARRPNQLALALWTDHFRLAAIIETK